MSAVSNGRYTQWNKLRAGHLNSYYLATGITASHWFSTHVTHLLVMYKRVVGTQQQVSTCPFVIRIVFVSQTVNVPYYVVFSSLLFLPSSYVQVFSNTLSLRSSFNVFIPYDLPMPEALCYISNHVDFCADELPAPRLSPPSWRITHCCLSVTSCSRISQLPSRPSPSATWALALPWVLRNDVKYRAAVMKTELWDLRCPQLCCWHVTLCRSTLIFKRCLWRHIAWTLGHYVTFKRRNTLTQCRITKS